MIYNIIMKSSIYKVNPSLITTQRGVMITNNFIFIKNLNKSHKINIKHIKVLRIIAKNNAVRLRKIYFYFYRLKSLIIC